MATRFLSDDPFPYVRVRISIRSWQTETLALLDTGFTGDVMIPANVLPDDIGNPDSVRRYRVADDRIATAAAFYGDLAIPGVASIANTTIGSMGSRYIIGQGVIEKYVVILERGERVLFEE